MGDYVMERTIELINVTGGGDCELLNYGSMRDVLPYFDYICIFFKQNEVVAVEAGGWALSALLTGKIKTDGGSIIYNNRKLSQSELRQIACYVGEDSGIKKLFGLADMTVSEQIKYGIAHGLSYNESVSDIKNLFGLSDGRFNRKFRFVSGERWRISMAIGYATGKFLYCFPWVNSYTIEKLKDIFKRCFPALIEIGAIILIPTTEYGRVSHVMEIYNPTVIQNG